MAETSGASSREVSDAFAILSDFVAAVSSAWNVQTELPEPGDMISVVIANSMSGPNHRIARGAFVNVVNATQIVGAEVNAAIGRLTGTTSASACTWVDANLHLDALIKITAEKILNEGTEDVAQRVGNTLNSGTAGMPAAARELMLMRIVSSAVVRLAVVSTVPKQGDSQ